MFPRPRTECASGGDDDLDAGIDRPPNVLAAQVERSRQPVHLERDIRLERDREGLVQIERVLWTVVEPALGYD